MGSHPSWGAVLPAQLFEPLSACCRARGTDRNWTRVDRKMSWSPAASSSQQRARVLTGVKARRFAPPPLRGADGLDAGSAHARPDWLLPTMLTHTPPTCCGRRPVQPSLTAWNGHLLPAGPGWALAPMRQEEPYHPVSERRRGRVFVGEAWAVAGMGLESVEPDEVIAQDATSSTALGGEPRQAGPFP